MSSTVAPLTYAMKLYYDDVSRRWGFSGRCEELVISGSADTLVEAQRESLAALRSAFECLREDGLLPADPVVQAAVAAS